MLAVNLYDANKGYLYNGKICLTFKLILWPIGGKKVLHFEIGLVNQMSLLQKRQAGWL